MNKLRKLTCLLLVVLCMTSFTVPALAYADDSAAATPTESTTVEDPDPTTSETADEEDVEIPYTFTISEDGSVVISINGVEWDIDLEDEEGDSTTGRVTTNGGRLNLRTGAGMSYQIIDQLRNGEEVTVIGTEGDWYKVVIPEKTGYVHSDYLELLGEADENSEIDSAMLMLMLNLMFQNMNSAEDTQTEWTPDGNLTLIDDILQIESPATEDSELQEKQFITLQSKAGNYFYLVIDRTGDTENVYFMNLIDEADLMALIESDDTTEPVCSCKDKCAVGAINTNCEICRSNMSECVGKEPVVEPEPTEPVEEPAEEPKSSATGPLIILLLAVAGGGAFYWFKIRKPKPKTNGDSDLDDYDYGQDDDEEDDFEIDDADVMAEADSTTDEEK